MRTLRHFGIFATLIVLSAAALAEADPPSRVARLDYMSGQVSIQPGGVNDWVAATINRPLTSADRIWSDKESRAELQLGNAYVRMDNETSLGLTNVSDNAVQLELYQGTLNLSVRHLFPGEVFEIDTPNTAFTVTKSGSYRFDVDSDGDSTLVTVWKGKGVATGDGPAVEVRQHDQVRFEGGRSLQHAFFSAPPMDGFDDWARVRDDRLDHVMSARYVSPYVIGYEDLDGYGHWRYVIGYGWVWVPYSVAAGWAPYREGHWIWVDPWGWTWVDDAPWGFAPFHYGRWVYTGGYWGWCPGPVYARPYYAPALVAWVGGAHWGIGIGIGSAPVGWFPLGYNEPYIPYYRVSRGYYQRVNVTNTRITNVTVINNYYNNVNIQNVNYRYRTNVNAVTVVNQDTIIHSRPVWNEHRTIEARELRQGGVMAGPQLPPSRTSVLGIHHDQPVRTPNDRIFSRQVVTKMERPPRPVPFEVRERAIADNHGRPIDHDTENRLRRDHPEFNRPDYGRRDDRPMNAGDRDMRRGPDRGNDRRDDSRMDAARPDNRGPQDRRDDDRINAGRDSRVPRPDMGNDRRDDRGRGDDRAQGNDRNQNNDNRGFGNNAGNDNGRAWGRDNRVPRPDMGNDRRDDRGRGDDRAQGNDRQAQNADDNRGFGRNDRVPRPPDKIVGPRHVDGDPASTGNSDPRGNDARGPQRNDAQQPRSDARTPQGPNRGMGNFPNPRNDDSRVQQPNNQPDRQPMNAGPDRNSAQDRGNDRVPRPPMNNDRNDRGNNGASNQPVSRPMDNPDGGGKRPDQVPQPDRNPGMYQPDRGNRGMDRATPQPDRSQSVPRPTGPVMQAPAPDRGPATDRSSRGPMNSGPTMAPPAPRSEAAPAPRMEAPRVNPTPAPRMDAPRVSPAPAPRTEAPHGAAPAAHGAPQQGHTGPKGGDDKGKH